MLFTVMALHSINDYASFQAPDTPLLALASPFIAIGSYLVFKFHARELTLVENAANVPPGWRGHHSHSEPVITVAAEYR